MWIATLDIGICLEEPHKKSQFAHHWYERTWLTTITIRCLAALPAKMSSFSSYITCSKTATFVT